VHVPAELVILAIWAVDHNRAATPGRSNLANSSAWSTLRATSTI